ncbi:hypothetical protein KI809_11280 [Geobacter pelophilus]|uniref:Uncharacterized protein n=1 Tax=Geoanaerobacter pelophilus TaxID=60036 RepID=A0AAW4L758_9BACT|nr:hypothetical protein [Geoanaerobacter pelophilus]MBT0664883.1 hypothetical protein [Geoanaerobacter pelophilus]
MKRINLVSAGLLLIVSQAHAGNGDLNVSGNITAASVSAPLNGNATTATSLVTSRGTITTNETGTYGNLQISGNKNGYFGIRSSDFGRTFMFSPAVAGIYKDSGAWSWYFDDNGVLVIGSVPGGNVTGTVANATNAVNLNGQPASYYQAAATAINTGNIGSQSVSYAASAGSAASATNAGQLNSQPGSFYQNASNLSVGTIPWQRQQPGTVIRRYYSSIVGSRTYVSNFSTVDTAPTLTAGTELFSQAISANNATDIIRVSGVLNTHSAYGGTGVVIGVFAGNNLIGVVSNGYTTSGQITTELTPFSFEFSPATTGSIIYSVRGGAFNAGGTWYLNGRTDTDAGGTIRSTFTIEEIVQ